MANSLPELPIPSQGDWPSSVYEAYDVLQTGFTHTAHMLALDDADPLRLNVLLDKATGTYKDILVNLCDQPGLPEEWIMECAALFADQVERLIAAFDAACGREDQEIHHESYVNVEHTGRPGRPRKVVRKDVLEQALRDNPNVSKSQLAQELNVHRNTLRAKMKEMGLGSDFTSMADAELDELVAGFKQSRPLTGYSYIVGSLRKKGIKVSQKRLKASLRRVDRLAAYLRSKKATSRRQYKVKRPHALWHLDGHHKLIRWGIVIHGIIDGYSRLIIALRAHTNNEAETVETLFKEGARNHKTYPSRTRGDRGPENVKVAVLMIILRGLNRGSFIWGSSTHNTRIERLWLEIGRFLGHQWRAFFTRLERLHHLDPQKRHHLWILHTLFLDNINRDCEEFVETWNHKPISGDGKHRSPNDMMRIGKAFHGIYREVDDCDGLDEETIEQYYGVVGRVRERPDGHYGAGDSDNEDELHGQTKASKAAVREIQAEEILKQIEPNVKHDPIDVPAGGCPFPDGDSATRFQILWEQLVTAGFIPSGFGLTADEMDAPYPSFELIRHGKGRSKTLNVPLPHDPWKARAELWAISVYALERFCLENDIPL